jgi:hypothetical protein
MAEITIKPIGFKMGGLRTVGCSVEIGGGVRIEFQEVFKGIVQQTIFVQLTNTEAFNIMGSAALFLGYDFVKKEGV